VKKTEYVIQQTTITQPAPAKKKNLSKKLKAGEIDKKYQGQNNAVNDTFGMVDPKRKAEFQSYE
jgi:hypothetical protein